MDIDYTDIINAMSEEEELARLLPMIKDIAIIEYDGKNIDGSCALAQYLDDKNIVHSVVSRIILLGKKNALTNRNEGHLSELYPDARITSINKLWHETNPQDLKVRNTLVLHIGNVIGITGDMFDWENGSGKTFVDFVNKTRVAYYVCILHAYNTSIFDSTISVRFNVRLKDFALETETTDKPRTNFCKEKQDYLMNCINTLRAQDAFFQCIDEAEHGCEYCDQCGNYGIRKQCPFAQRAVARFYREGIYVPQDERIAHQWEVKASLQDYKSACIQVADDLKNGLGCKKNIESALDIYSSYASKIGNEYCINKILEIAEEESDINKNVAIPFIAQQAHDGNEDMIIKLSDAFQSEEYGLPKDIVQQEEWILQGAENGNPRFVLAMGEMYEKISDWGNAYKWYKSLDDIGADVLDEDKLNEVELKMLTNGSSPEDVAISGRDYLFGYFGKERDLHLAFRCLKYASDNDVASAKGLLGVMYLEGWDVEKDFDTAIELLSLAAEADDLYSMDKLTDLHYSDDNNYNDGYRWEKIIEDRIEEGISKDNPFAYYLKGHYQHIGYQYDDDDNAAFDNLLKAAELGIPKAQFELSEMYSSHIGDSYNADVWLNKAATNGYFMAEGKYGIKLFEESSWYNDNKNRSFNFLKHAYEQGYDEAYWCLAQCYMNGNGTDVNKELAYPLYQRAAEEDILKAQEFLSQKYFRGDSPLPQDYMLCAKWGEEAIKKGCKSIRFETAYSQSHIGNHTRAKELYLELSNEGNAAAMNNYACELSDVKEKAEWFQKAADKGDDYGMWNVAKYYKNGTGVEKNIEKAVELLKKSASKGHTGAMQDLAYMYRCGDCVDVDGAAAIQWYEKAAEKDEMDAVLALAEIYKEGEIVPENIEKAIHYYKLAAEKDNLSALFKLGEVYEYGTGVEQNIHKAIYWYRKAANKGSNSAMESLKRLNSNWLDANGNIDDEPDKGVFDIFD